MGDNDNSRFDVGMGVRSEVLGAEHVERSLENATAFTRPMQDLVTEYCWGTVWSRPGLDRRTRSLINLGMLTALNRRHELGVHIRGALNNGVTKKEMREIFLHCGAYCGAPAALDAFKVAKQLFAEDAAASTKG
ncbi:MAG: carboxymuconolactone decarboxylase family protein [Solirubrobacteraceae bacterium]